MINTFGSMFGEQEEKNDLNRMSSTSKSNYGESELVFFLYLILINDY